jgi:succinoglycan biosynthesis protein ExoW
MLEPDIGVVIPHFQRQSGLLPAAVRSAFAQTLAERVVVVIGDDSSPVSAESELRGLQDIPQQRIVIVRRPNGGAGAARNSALDALPASVRYVAYLDSDDAWRPHHLASAMRALDAGYDAYFCNFIGVGFPDIGHFDRIGSLQSQDHPLLDAELRLHALAVSALEHTVGDGGGLIQTSTVVYRHHKWPRLRFREEFYNGQDFFFWMDLSQLGARFAFSFDIGCENGTGINIYQGSGWGTERSMQRIRNELFVWTSVERFYPLSEPLRAANRRTIRELQANVAGDLMHRVRHRKPLPGRLLADIVRMAPSTLWVAPTSALRIALGKLARDTSGPHPGELPTRRGR